MATALAAMACGPERSARKSGEYSDEDKGLQRTNSEEQCDIMVEALHRELDQIKDQLAWLTYHLDDGDEKESARSLETQPDRATQPSRLSGTRSGADTPHTAKKKMEREKEAIERAARAAQIEKERKRHYLAVVDSTENKRKQFNDEYLRLLKLHVEHQRQQVEENSKRLLQQMKRREKKQKALKLQSKPVRFRSQLQKEETSSFLKKLYHSTYYQVIGVELEMRRNGKLKTLTDLKEFWELMLGPPLTPKPPYNSSHKATPTHFKPHPSAEDEEEEFTSWAITALPPEINQKSRKPQLPTSFQPSAIPQISPISSLLSDSHTTHSNSKNRSQGCLKRIEAVERERHHTRHMYQQARANEMAMRKLLPDIDSLRLDGAAKIEDEKEEGIGRQHQSILEAGPISCTEQQTTSDVELLRTVDTSGRSTSRLAKTMNNTSSRNSSLKKEIAAPSKEIKSRESLEKKVIIKAAPPPLTMTSLLETSSAVKEPKGKSALWSNYN